MGEPVSRGNQAAGTGQRGQVGLPALSNTEGSERIKMLLTSDVKFNGVSHVHFSLMGAERLVSS